jgi:NADPH:quinone reductase-like Zn-dependent oxidoreductase
MEATAERMKAVVRTRWGAPGDVVELVEVARPALADDEALVRVRAASVNRADYYAAGDAAILVRPMMGGFLRPKDERLGNDFAGIVEAVGPNAIGLQAGDEVYGLGSGAFAEYVCVGATVARKPDNLSFEQAAAVPMASLTALEALRDHGRLVPGQRVLVNGGSGGVGSFAVQLAKALGAGRVTAVCSARNAQRALALGADTVIDYTREDYTRNSDRYELIIDVAGTHSWRQNLRVLVPGGRLVLTGLPQGNHLTGPIGPLVRLWLTSRLGRRRKLLFFICKPNRANLETLRELIEDSKLHPTIDRVYPLAEVADALEAMGHGHTQGKLVIRIG